MKKAVIEILGNNQCILTVELEDSSLETAPAYRKEVFLSKEALRARLEEIL